MSNNYEDIIKNEVNKYMEQIEVPRNIGGIIMEDFEKIKKEEEKSQNQNYNYEEVGNGKKKSKKALKISIVAVSAVALIGTGVFIGSRFLGNNTIINNNGAQNSNMATNNQIFDKKITIRENQIENFGKLNQFLRNVHNGTEDEIEIETYLEPEWELVASTKEPSKLYVKYDGTKYNVKYDIAEGMRYSKQTVEGEFSDILIRKTTSQSAEYIEMELTFYRINNNKVEILPVFFFKLSDVGIDPAESSVKDLLSQDYKTYKKMNDEISNEIYDGLYNLEKDLSDKFGESVYKQKLQQLDIKDESSVINLIKDKGASIQQDLVTDAFTYTKTIKDIYDEVYSYKIPKININSSEVDEINKEINDKIISQAKEGIQFLEKNEGGGLYRVDYSYYINNNVLSIVINLEYDSDIVDYYVYNINITTGAKVTNEEILKIKKMTDNQFSEKLSSATKIEFINKYGSKDAYMNDLKNSDAFNEESELKEQESIYVTQYNKNISTSNCKIDNNKIYLSDNQNLNVVTTIYSLAGAEEYEHILNLDDEKTFIVINKETQARENLTKEEITDLTDFLNKTENNSFILMDYSSAMDLIQNHKYQKHKEVLKYSIAASRYVKNATVEQCLKLYNVDSIDKINGETYLINENDFVSFFRDKLGVTFEKDFIKQVFKEYYNQDFQMYYFSMSDSAFTKTSIQSSYKIGDVYYLKLNHGQTVKMQKNGDSNYLFCSCIGYDGSIGF